MSMLAHRSDQLERQETCEAIRSPPTERDNLYTVFESPDGTRHLSPWIIYNRDRMKEELDANDERNARILELSASGVSQREVARLCGVGQTTVSRIVALQRVLDEEAA